MRISVAGVYPKRDSARLPRKSRQLSAIRVRGIVPSRIGQEDWPLRIPSFKDTLPPPASRKVRPLPNRGPPPPFKRVTARCAPNRVRLITVQPDGLTKLP